MKTVSFVIPCYNSSNTLLRVVTEVDEVMEEINHQYSYEMILVNDCSKDSTFDLIKEISRKRSNIIGLNFAKNFGQHSALMAGFSFSKGDIVICLDDDGQMPVESVPELIKTIESGYDVVFGKYDSKKQSWFKNFGSKVNEFMCVFMLEKPDGLQMNSFWGAKKYVIDEILNYKGAYPYLAGLILRTTRNFTNIDVKHRKRLEGNTGYSFKKLLSLWLNGFTAFSIKPLRVASLLGTIFALLGFIVGIITVIRKLLNPEILLGYSSIVTFLMFIGGIIMLMLGIIGEYIGRIYICINNSPQYVIKEIVKSLESN